MKNLLNTLTLLALTFTLPAQNFEKQVSPQATPNYDEGEAHIVMSPIDPLKMAVGFMLTGQGPVEFHIFHTEDGGNSWTATNLNTHNIARADYPSLNVIGGGDILLNYDKQGKLYASWIHLMGNPMGPGGIDSLRWLSFWASSDDNGANFNFESGDKKYFGEGKLSMRNGITVHYYKDGITDRQWMVTDLSNGPFANRLYMGFINYTYVIENSGLRVITKDSNQTEFSSYKTAYSGSGQFTNLAIDGTGNLHYTFCDVDSNFIYHVSSNDGGQTFSDPHLIYKGNNLAPETGFTHRRDNAAPSLAIDGNNNLHLVWGDFQGNTDPLAYYASSSDGGTTWSTPLALENLFGSALFLPVVCTYDDIVTIGAQVLNDQNEASYHMITSRDQGQNFGPPIALSSSSTDMTQHYSNFHGDYSTSMRTECDVYSLWTDCRTGDCVMYLARYNDCDAVGYMELTPIQSEWSLLSVYPNPVKDVLSVELESKESGRMSFRILDINGSELLNEEREMSKGQQIIRLNLEELASGSYVLQCQNENGVQITRRLLVE